jgi:hypothetical protein
VGDFDRCEASTAGHTGLVVVQGIIDTGFDRCEASTGGAEDSVRTGHGQTAANLAAEGAIAMGKNLERGRWREIRTVRVRKKARKPFGFITNDFPLIFVKLILWKFVKSRVIKDFRIN